jgi:hypothetical protein
MAALEILEHIGELACGARFIEGQHPIDNVVGAGLVGRPKVLRLRLRFEWSDDDPSRIRPEMEGLPI